MRQKRYRRVSERAALTHEFDAQSRVARIGGILGCETLYSAGGNCRAATDRTVFGPLFE